MKLKTTILGQIIVCGVALCALAGATNPGRVDTTDNSCEQDLHYAFQKAIDDTNDGPPTDDGRVNIYFYQDILTALQNPNHPPRVDTIPWLEEISSEIRKNGMPGLPDACIDFTVGRLQKLKLPVYER